MLFHLLFLKLAQPLAQPQLPLANPNLLPMHHIAPLVLPSLPPRKFFPILDARRTPNDLRTKRSLSRERRDLAL